MHSKQLKSCLRISQRRFIFFFLFINTLVAVDLYSFNMPIASNNMSYYKNKSVVSDTNVKYISYSNDLIVGYRLKELLIKSYKEDGIFYKNSFTRVRLINNNTYKIEANGSSIGSVVECYRMDSVREIEEVEKADMISFIDTNTKNSLYYLIANHRIQINFDMIRAASVKELKYKIENTDSLRYDIDSNIVVYGKLNSYIIEKMFYRQYDTLDIDSISKSMKFSISNDTLSINTNLLDTNKSIRTSYEEGIAVDSENVYVSYVQDEKKREQNAILIGADFDGTKYVVKSDIQPIGYRYTNYSTTMSFDTLRNYSLFYLERMNTENKLEYSNLIAYYSSTLNPIFKLLTVNNSNEIVLIGSTRTKLLGEFNKKSLDSNGSNTFISSYYNGFILKSNNECKLLYSNYINFANNYANIYINDYKKVRKREFIVGVIDSLTNTDSMKISHSYLQSSKYTSFIMKYGHPIVQKSNIIPISANISSEYCSLNSIDNAFDNKGNIFIAVSGTTNATTLFNSPSWTKSTTDNCSIILTTNYFADSVSKIFRIEGDSNEGKYFAKSNFHLNFSKIYIQDFNNYSIFGLTNSSTFNNTDTNTLKNDKGNYIYSTYCAKIDSNNLIKKLLYVNSEYDQSIIKVDFQDNIYSMLIQGKSNNYSQPPVKDTVVTDTLADTLNINSCIIVVDDNLSLLNDGVTVKCKPIWVTYFDTQSYDCLMNDYYIKSNELNIVGRVKNKNWYTKYYTKTNGNNTYIYYDALLCSIYMMGILY